MPTTDDTMTRERLNEIAPLVTEERRAYARMMVEASLAAEVQWREAREKLLAAIGLDLGALCAAALRGIEDGERLDWLERMAHDADVPEGEWERIGDVLISGSWQTQTVEVGLGVYRGEGKTVRAAIDAARSPLPEVAAACTPTTETR